jgi:hypothetical protein
MTLPERLLRAIAAVRAVVWAWAETSSARLRRWLHSRNPQAQSSLHQPSQHHTPERRTMASIFAQPYFKGTALGRLKFYRSGTLVAAPVYADAAATVPLTTVRADSAGRYPPIYLDTSVSYRCIESYASGEVIRDIDPITREGLSGGATDALTITDLTALEKGSLTTGLDVAVLGYAKAGDGGGGVFEWDATSVAATVPGMVLAADEGGTGRWTRVDKGPASIFWFGAKGDGTTVDTAAINTAIAQAQTGETVEFGEGVFLTAGGHVAPANKIISFVGWPNGTALKLNGAGTLLTHTGDPDNVYGIRKTEAILFDGNGADAFNFRPGTTGYKAGDTSGYILHAGIRDCRFFRLETGALHYSVQQNLVERSIFHRNKVGAIYRPDAVNGGSTASSEYKTVYEYNSVGVLLEKYFQTFVPTVATMTNSSTSLTAVGTTAGMAVGMAITGPGIKSGTTVAAFTANTITLSQMTTTTAARANVPILVNNSGSYSTDGDVFRECLWQGNFTAAVAGFGYDSVRFEQCYFEANPNDGAYPSATIGGRTIPAYGVYFEGTSATFTECWLFNSYTRAMFSLRAGSQLQLRDCVAAMTGDFIDGDQTSSVEFFGSHSHTIGAALVPVKRWPDTIKVNISFSGVGNATQTRTNAIPNAFTGANPRLPAYAIDGGAITVANEVDARLGMVRSIAFPATTGALGINSVGVGFAGGTVSTGSLLFASILIRADTYTKITTTFAGVANSTVSLSVTPEWQRMVVIVRASGDQTSVSHNLFPTGADGPKIYVANEMQLLVPPGADESVISQVLAEGLFNDGTADGALLGSATYDPPSLTTGTQTTTTITVNGAALGDPVSASFSADLQAIQLTAYVSAANTVTCIFRNGTAGTIDLASGTLRVRVLK